MAEKTDRRCFLARGILGAVGASAAYGSIEEKILALQDKKAALADAILSEDPAHADKFGAQDLEALFAPLPRLSASI